MVQTGLNNHEGGAQDGLIIVVYHEVVLFMTIL